METVDEDLLAATLDFIDRQHKAGKPFFVWFNSTRMHVWTHLKPELDGKTGLYPDGMVEHDGHVGQLLKKLDDLGIANNTVVVYTTDNGAEVKPGTIINDMCAHEDLLPTFAAAGGEPDVEAKSLNGYAAGGKTFRVHLDGSNLMPFFKGEVQASPRQHFLYWNDDGQLTGVRVQHLKVVFLEQQHKGLDVWRGEFTSLRIPKVFNLRADPFERGDESIFPMATGQMFFFVPAQAVVA